MKIKELKSLIEFYTSELNKLEFQVSVAKNALDSLQKELENSKSESICIHLEKISVGSKEEDNKKPKRKRGRPKKTVLLEQKMKKSNFADPPRPINDHEDE